MCVRYLARGGCATVFWKSATDLESTSSLSFLEATVNAQNFLSSKTVFWVGMLSWGEREPACESVRLGTGILGKAGFAAASAGAAVCRLPGALPLWPPWVTRSFLPCSSQRRWRGMKNCCIVQTQALWVWFFWRHSPGMHQDQSCPQSVAMRNVFLGQDWWPKLSAFPESKGEI